MKDVKKKTDESYTLEKTLWIFMHKKIIWTRQKTPLFWMNLMNLNK